MSDDDGRDTRLVAIRGAIDVASDTTDEVKRAVSHLVRQMDTRNAITHDAIVSAHFTMTPDLRCVFPAAAARISISGSIFPIPENNRPDATKTLGRSPDFNKRFRFQQEPRSPHC